MAAHETVHIENIPLLSHECIATAFFKQCSTIKIGLVDEMHI